MSIYRRSGRSGDLSNETLFARRSAHYGTAEFLDEQWRLTDMVPLRLSTYLLIFLVAAGVIGGLEGLYYVMPQFASMTSDGRVAAFDLDGEGSLAVWFSSTMLLLAAGSAMLVYTVRRFRRDDYYGRYRVWIWGALVFLLMSIDETGSLHEGFKELMTWTTGNRVLGDGSIWWVMAYFFVLGVIGSRLVVDMRSCRTSTAAMFAAGSCYILAVVTQLEGVLPQSGARGVMVEEGAEMFGNVFLLMAMLLHARYVILDAEGLLPTRRGSSLEPVDYEYDVEDDEEEAWGTVDADEIVVHPPRGLRRLLRSRTSRLSRPDPVVDQIISPVSRKLTRQEKEVLRHKLEKARRLREEGLT
ncbi:MAG: hypothetical protein ACYC6Y_06955 [Thermoguttaceae bacterium]